METASARVFLMKDRAVVWPEYTSFQEIMAVRGFTIETFYIDFMII
jgi:hypothetical protein